MTEIDLIKEFIVRLYQPDKIILFGSWARGGAGDLSDIDLLVISDREKHLPRYKRGFINTILREGRVLYER